MRTTLTSDDGIAVRLAEIRAEDGERFKTLLNRVFRAGLAALRAGERREPARAFSTKICPAKCLLPGGMAAIQRDAGLRRRPGLEMRLFDANLLVYATFSAMPRHAAAKRWLDGILRGREQAAFSPVSALKTRSPRIFDPHAMANLIP